MAAKSTVSKVQTLMDKLTSLRRALLALGALSIVFSLMADVVSAQVDSDVGGVVVGRLDAPIDPVAARILRGWLSDAHDSGAELFVLELDTPGGDLDSMRDMVGDILDSPVPVAVLVTPSGSRAASAGTFLVASAHVAAMSPGTNIGAASPVGVGGVELPETIKAKATQDAAALLRSIASQRDRNSEALVKTITEAASYSDVEALELGILDILAVDARDLLDKINGREVLVQGSPITLETDGVSVRRAEIKPVQKVLQFLADPTLVFILIAAGGIFILFEILIPGGWVAGVLGAGFLILAFLGLGSLPVNWIGLALIGAGLVLFFVELQAPGWGGFGLAGGISFILGGFFLFGDTSVPGLPAPDVRIGYGVLGATAAAMAVSLVSLWFFSRKARNITVVSRRSQIVGQAGVVRTTLEPRGTVQVAGELWTAHSLSCETIESGESIVVSDMEGVILTVYREE